MNIWMKGIIVLAILGLSVFGAALFCSIRDCNRRSDV